MQGPGWFATPTARSQRVRAAFGRARPLEAKLLQGPYVGAYEGRDPFSLFFVKDLS